MASIFSIFVIALVVSFSVVVQGTIAHSPLDFLKNLNGTKKGDKVESIGQLKRYLARLGYIDPTANPTKNSAHDAHHIFDDTLHEALRKYQEFFAIEPTGNLDSKTVESMLQPRCGVPDIRLNHNTSFGDMKYSFAFAKWPIEKRHLTVSFPNGTRADFDAVSPALQKWAAVSDFSFAWVDDVSGSDVKMSFESGEHGPHLHEAFGGPGGDLAHAASGPNDIPYVYLHFNGDIGWGTNEYTEKGKYDLQSIALHELGHVLGLGHSKHDKTVMWPQIKVGRKRRFLTSDDIDGITALYCIGDCKPT